jgi:hypothetical protein
LLGYRDSHPFASKVGEVESTAQPLGYRHPVLPTLMIWDMPGAGTKSHPAKTYYEDKYLQAFDALVIVTGDRYGPKIRIFFNMLEHIFCTKLSLTPYRLMATDVHIARAAHAQGQPYYIVRNKMDVVSSSNGFRVYVVTHYSPTAMKSLQVSD